MSVGSIAFSRSFTSYQSYSNHLCSNPTQSSFAEMGVIYKTTSPNGIQPHLQTSGVSNKVKVKNTEFVDKQREDGIPKPKVVFYSLNNVCVGYKQPRRAGAGMLNVGNTCYLNSTLQALFHTPALFNYLISNNHSASCKFGGGCIVCAMSSTLKESLNSNVIKPRKIYEKLKSICKHLVHGRQEDAHEFLRYLIESLQRSFLQSNNAMSKSLDTASKETTPFNRIFGGYIRQDVTCLRCKHVSKTVQHFMELLLDIRQANTIEDALQFHFRAEKIGGDRADYKCERCKIKVPAKKQCRIERPPAVLCIQLKRFNLFGGKINKPVQLRRTINIAPYVNSKNNAEVKYKLVSMITHMGSSPSCGHYTAIGEAANGQFFQFDDSSVRPIPEGKALNTASYILFYEMMPPSWEKHVQSGGRPQGAAAVDRPKVVLPSADQGSVKNNGPALKHKPAIISVSCKPSGEKVVTSKESDVGKTAVQISPTKVDTSAASSLPNPRPKLIPSPKPFTLVKVNKGDSKETSYPTPNKPPAGNRSGSNEVLFKPSSMSKESAASLPKSPGLSLPKESSTPFPSAPKSDPKPNLRKSSSGVWMITKGHRSSSSSTSDDGSVGSTSGKWIVTPILLPGNRLSSSTTSWIVTPGIKRTCHASESSTEFSPKKKFKFSLQAIL